VFIYLPLWFSFGAIFYLALRVATARVGGSLNGPTVSVLSLIALIVLVSASVLQPVARVGLALAAVAVGATTASLLWGAPSTKSDRGPAKREGDAGKFTDVLRTIVGAQSEATPEREKLDIGRALVVGAASLFVVFAALQYDYKILRSITKFSAGEVVSVEFSQSGQNSKGFSGGAFLVQNGQVAALPRTQSVLYVTDQLSQLDKIMEREERLASIISGTDSPKYIDYLNQGFKAFVRQCVSPLAVKLSVLQKNNHSEFPTVGGIPSISFLLRRLYDGAKDRHKVEIDGGIDQAIIEYENMVNIAIVNIDVSLQNTGCKDYFAPKPGRSPRIPDRSLNYILNTSYMIMDNSYKTKYDNYIYSNILGYLASLTAFAEFVDGNRESGVRLLDDRISEELRWLEVIRRTESVEKPYLIARKQALIVRLIRWETILIEFIQEPTPSPTLDEIAFGRFVSGIQLYPIDVSNIYKSKVALHGLIGTTIGRAESGCLDGVPSGDGLAHEAFWDSVYTHFVLMNNALTFAARNGAIILSLNWEGDSELRPEIPGGWSQRDLIANLDRWASELVKVAPHLNCLQGENVKISSTPTADFLESVGNYYEMKGNNFGAAVAARTDAYDDADTGPVQRAEDRIKSLCYAKIMFNRASESLKQTPSENLEQTPGENKVTTADSFDDAIQYYDDYSFQRKLNDRSTSIAAQLTQSYTPSQLDSYCPSSYP
jgi:hypothetical protein